MNCNKTFSSMIFIFLSLCVSMHWCDDWQSKIGIERWATKQCQLINLLHGTVCESMHTSYKLLFLILQHTSYTFPSNTMLELLVYIYLYMLISFNNRNICIEQSKQYTYYSDRRSIFFTRASHFSTDLLHTHTDQK